MSAQQGSVLRAGVLAGMVGAILVATPFLNILNSCCCALTVAVGAFAAWMLRSDSGGTASTERCVLAGMTSGVVSALVGIPLGAVLSRLAFGIAHLEGQVEQALEQGRQFLEGLGQPPPPGSLEGLEAGLRATSGLEINGWLVVAALFFALVQALFGLIGGLLGALMTQRQALPPTPPAPPPPAEAPFVDPDLVAGSPAAMPPPQGVPDDSAPAVLGEDGRPEVRWTGPVVEAAGLPSPGAPAAPQAPAPDPGRGEIPADELPLLPQKSEAPEQPEEPEEPGQR